MMVCKQVRLNYMPLEWTSSMVMKNLETGQLTGCAGQGLVLDLPHHATGRRVAHWIDPELDPDEKTQT